MNFVQFREKSTITDEPGFEGSGDEAPLKEGKRRQLRRVSAVLIARVKTSEKSPMDGDLPLSLRSRRIRHSDNVSSVLRSPSSEIDSFIKETTSHAFAELDLSKEKRSLRQELRRLNDHLSKCLNDPAWGMKLKPESNQASVTAFKGKTSPESVIVVMQLIRRAVDLEICGVYNDHGKWISMLSLFNKFQKLKEQNAVFNHLIDEKSLKLLKKAIDLNVDRKVGATSREIRELTIPPEAEKFTEDDQRIISLLQRLYPHGKPDMGLADPVKLLLAYPLYVSTKRLFELVQFLLESSDDYVPPIQKQRLLCFCRIWISRGYHPGKIQNENVHACLNDIVKVGLSSEDPLTRDLADDLSMRMMKAPLHARKYSFRSGALSSEELIEDLSKSNTNKTVDLFARDISRVSRGLFLNIPLTEMLQKPTETVHLKAFTDNFEQLAHFVKYTVLSPVSSKSTKKEREKIYRRISFWIKVAHVLKKKGDFHSALAVVSALSDAAISRLFCPATGNKALSKSTKISQRTLKKWKKLDSTFSAFGNFKVLKEEINQRKKMHLPVIPYAGTFLSDYVHTMDGNSDFVKEEINLEKLDLIAKLLRNFWEDLNRLRKKRKGQSPNNSLKTDLYEQVGRFHKNFNEDFWELSTSVKPFKGQ